MAPVVLAAVWFGRPWLPILAVVGAALMGWEWARLSYRGTRPLVTALIVLTPAVAVAVAAFGSSLAAVLLALAGTAAILLAVSADGAPTARWAAGGTLWLALPCIVFVWLTADPEVGRAAVLWLLAVVWATDIAAYAAGRSIGGPRLAPRLSPNKTWAGLAGGMVGAGIVGYVAAWLVGANAAILVPLSMALAVCAQLGDLAESLAKRHFGVKDSSGLIPGHGGLLDRVDGLLTAAAAQGIVTWLAGASPLVWR